MDEIKKVIIVSGGSRGLGKRIVEDFLEKNYVVATFSRSETEFITTCKKRYGSNNNFEWEHLDVMDFKALKTFVFRIYKKYGRIDCLINNAGCTLEQLLPITTSEDIRRILGVNLDSVIELTRLVSKIMIQQHHGNILTISSIVGHRGYKGSSVYSASKAALVGFTKSLAREMGSVNIRVNAILPGFLATDMTKNMPQKQKEQILRRTPLGRMGTVDDIIGTVRLLTSDDSQFITGQSIVIDGGLTC
jgi:3-oxoacyl-[acyl-carrier protein] reductase